MVQAVTKPLLAQCYKVRYLEVLYGMITGSYIGRQFLHHEWAFMNDARRNPDNLTASQWTSSRRPREISLQYYTTNTVGCLIRKCIPCVVRLHNHLAEAYTACRPVGCEISYHVPRPVGNISGIHRAGTTLPGHTVSSREYIVAAPAFPGIRGYSICTVLCPTIGNRSDCVDNRWAA